MSKLVNLRGATPERVPAGLSDRLVWLKSFGRPRLSCMSDGTWLGTIDMHVSAKGAEFKVQSEFDCASPDDAVAQLIERMLDTLARIGAAA